MGYHNTELGSGQRPAAGGLVTNVGSLTVRAENALDLVPGGEIYANTATIPGTVTVNINQAQPPDSSFLNVNGVLTIAGSTLNIADKQGGLYIIAKYGSRSGEFAVTNGLPPGAHVDYNYQGGNVVALIAAAKGTVLVIR